MTASDIMVGDLVKTDKGVIKVESISTHRKRKIGYYNEGDMYHIRYASLGSVKPIPLSEEMLKLNGFDDNDLGYEFYDGYHIFLVKDVKNVHVGAIWFVHELQHALRLCGLNELADNFKLE